MVDMTMDQAMQNPFLKSLMAPYLQPAAQLQETQAAAQAAGASAGLQSTEQQTAQVKAQQAQAIQGLRGDLQKGVTLKDALNKYTALGMSADDVFKQYLAESPYGAPHEDPIELQHLGVSAGALGRIGDPGSFMDIYNTKNAITELRNLKDLYGQTNNLAKVLPGVGGAFPSAKAYEAAKTVFGNHLASLIPGASGAQATGQSLISQLPDVGNPTEPAAASGQFNAIEKQLLASKGYKYSDIGLAAPQTQQDTKKGGDLLSTLLTNAGKDVTGIVQGGAENQQKFGAGPGAAIMSIIAGVPGMIQQYADIAKNPGKQFTEHPVASSLAVAGPLMALFGLDGEAGATSEDTAAVDATTQAAKDVFSKAPNKLQQLFTPGKAKNIVGDIRNTLLDNATQAGKTISGDDYVNNFKAWAEQAKQANPSDVDAIDAATKNVESLYKGKNYTPNEIKSIYDRVPSAYSKSGIPRTSTQALIDDGSKEVLSKTIDDQVKGFQKTSDLFDQIYKGAPTRKLAVGGAKAALGLAGADRLLKMLTGIGF